jgi:hypothetical protein
MSEIAEGLGRDNLSDAEIRGVMGEIGSGSLIGFGDSSGEHTGD